MYLFFFSNGEISKEKQALSTFLDFFNLLWTLWSFLGGDIYPIISRGILLEKHKFQQESLSLWLQRHSSRIDRCRNRFHRTRSKWIFFFSKFYGKVGKTRPATTIVIHVDEISTILEDCTVYLEAYFGWFYIWYKKLRSILRFWLKQLNCVSLMRNDQKTAFLFQNCSVENYYFLEPDMLSNLFPEMKWHFHKNSKSYY